MITNLNDVAIILAGGKGERFGSQKQFIEFMGKALYKHVLDKTLQVFPHENIVVVGVDIEGGNTRSNSIINGLKYFNNTKNINKVLILEAARPLVTVEQIKKLLNSTSKSVSFVQPLVNTIIKKDIIYQNREDFYELLTPQCFDFKLLYDAYAEKEHWDMTDETRIIYEKYNIKPEFIMGGQNLVKLTYLRDLPFIEHLFKLQEKGNLE